MEYLKRMILLFLIAGFACSAISHPTAPENLENDDDYPGDDDYTYPDEISEVNIPQIENNEATGGPSIGTLESEKIANAGDDIVLPCNVRNLKENNVVFWYNGTTLITQSRIALTDRSRISVDSDYGLKITNVQESDSNVYNCEVLPERFKLKLNLVVKARKLRKDPYVAIYSEERNVSDRSITFNEGDRVEFECKAFNIKNPVFKWSLKGQRIDATSNVTRLENGKIIIENVDHHHHGLYQCIGDSGEAHPPHGSVQLNISFKPKISVTRHYVNTGIGDTAELYCGYHAFPDPTSMRWLKGNAELKPTPEKYVLKTDGFDQLYQKNRTVLFVKNISPADLGEYDCSVSNKMGEGRGRIHLILEPEPAHFENMSILGRKVSLNWLVRSKQPLSEAILDYQINGSQTWMSEAPISQNQHEHTGVWKIRHELELEPGTWHVRVKTKNIDGWSKFSKDHSFVIPNTPDSSSIPKDTLLTAGVGAPRENSASLLSSTLLTSLLLVTLSVVPSLCRL